MQKFINRIIYYKDEFSKHRNSSCAYIDQWISVIVRQLETESSYRFLKDTNEWKNIIQSIQKSVQYSIQNYSTLDLKLTADHKENIAIIYYLFLFLQKYKISVADFNVYKYDTQLFLDAVIFPFLEEVLCNEGVSAMERGDSASIKKIFIVHGHDETMKLQLKDFLQNRLNLPEPVILSQKSNRGQTIIEKFEDQADDVDLIFVLLSPDDFTVDQTVRARQNVIFELGYFMGKYGRKSGKIIILYKAKENFILPSDIYGIGYILVKENVYESSIEIMEEVQNYISQLTR